VEEFRDERCHCGADPRDLAQAALLSELLYGPWCGGQRTRRAPVRAQAVSLLAGYFQTLRDLLEQPRDRQIAIAIHS
jgi:hypothetical protein